MISLTILIPSTPDRRVDVVRLLANISRQTGIKDYLLHECADVINSGLSRDVEVIIFEDDRVLTLGEKRERLYKMAHGIYSWQIDSDDNIADNAIELILKAAKEDSDCITFRENCMMNGVYESSNHSLKYSKWQDNFDGYKYTRTPFYKDVIKTSIAQSVPFPKIRYNEDEQWSYALYPHLKTETHIDEEIYYYIYEPKDTHEERYGFNAK